MAVAGHCGGCTKGDDRLLVIVSSPAVSLVARETTVGAPRDEETNTPHKS